MSKVFYSFVITQGTELIGVGNEFLDGNPPVCNKAIMQAQEDLKSKLQLPFDYQLVILNFIEIE